MGVIIQQPKLFDDTTKPGKPIISIVIKVKGPIHVLKDFELSMSPMEYELLKWGNTIGYTHPALQDIEEDENDLLTSFKLK